MWNGMNYPQHLCIIFKAEAAVKICHQWGQNSRGPLLTSVLTVIYLLWHQQKGGCGVYNNYTRERSGIDPPTPTTTHTHLLIFCQSLVDFLIDHSEVVPIVEVPVRDRRRTRQGRMNASVMFLNLYSSIRIPLSQNCFISMSVIYVGR